MIKMFVERDVVIEIGVASRVRLRPRCPLAPVPTLAQLSVTSLVPAPRVQEGVPVRSAENIL